MAKIYTKKGDQGTTCLVSGESVDKNHTRLESYGTLDELNSIIGLCRAKLADGSKLDSPLFEVQNDLFNLGSQLANTDPVLKSKLPDISQKDVTKLESVIDQLTADLPPLKNFILPGGSEVSALLHVARTVCRRAERVIIQLKSETEVDPLCIQYINRLSDMLFVMARYSNFESKIQDVEWKKPSKS